MFKQIRMFVGRAIVDKLHEKLVSLNDFLTFDLFRVKNGGKRSNIGYK